MDTLVYEGWIDYEGVGHKRMAALHAPEAAEFPKKTLLLSEYDVKKGRGGRAGAGAAASSGGGDADDDDDDDDEGTCLARVCWRAACAARAHVRHSCTYVHVVCGWGVQMKRATAATTPRRACTCCCPGVPSRTATS